MTAILIKKTGKPAPIPGRAAKRMRPKRVSRKQWLNLLMDGRQKKWTPTYTDNGKPIVRMLHGSYRSGKRQ